MPWKQPRLNPKQLKKTNDELLSKLISVRAELQTAERHQVGLRALLATRGEKIDALTVEIERLRAQNRRLDQEAERLAEMVQLAPPAGASTAAAK